MCSGFLCINGPVLFVRGIERERALNVSVRMRRARLLCQFSAGSNNPFAGLMQAPPGGQGGAAGDRRFDGNFQGGGPFAAIDPSALQSMAAQMKRSMTPEVQENLRKMMSGMQQGQQDFGKMGIMAFGVGENEKGKKVARGAKIEFDPATGKISKDFHEHQLDPDDPMLSQSAESKAAEAAPCTEVQFEEDATPSSGNAAETVLESEVEVEPAPGHRSSTR